VTDREKPNYNFPGIPVFSDEFKHQQASLAPETSLYGGIGFKP
jgi:hypothetical protein